MENAAEKKKDRKSAKVYFAEFLSFVLVMIVVLKAVDVVRLICVDESEYEIKYEKLEDYPQAGQVYNLYIKGENKTQVDRNEYALLDKNGNTDYKYCHIMRVTNKFLYTALICAMLYLVIKIYMISCSGNPFTAGNIKLVRAICKLQIAVAFVPEIVRKTMSLIKFNYIYSVMEMERIYMIGIAIIICGIGYIFEKGLALKEDMDTIA
ncbi:MAG: DUF2975 domain-containing protein [Lachnospiraceae bacterium]|nr:DUF2975 domain-containing protein [Lachnospiraceae bacterium]